MAEMLVMLLIVSILESSFWLSVHPISTEFEDFILKFLTQQASSMSELQSISLEYGLSLNELGHINQAKTLYPGGKKVTVQLGMGRLLYEK